MQLAILSGDAIVGLCGEPGELKDIYTEDELYVGDIVLAFYIEKDGQTHSHYLTAVATNKYQSYSNTEKVDIIENKIPFVMGIAGCVTPETGLYSKFADVSEGWAYQRLKKWEDVLDGEKWEDFGFNYKMFDTERIVK